MASWRPHTVNCSPFRTHIASSVWSSLQSRGKPLSVLLLANDHDPATHSQWTHRNEVTHKWRNIQCFVDSYCFDIFLYCSVHGNLSFAANMRHFSVSHWYTSMTEVLVESLKCFLIIRCTIRINAPESMSHFPETSWTDLDSFSCNSWRKKNPCRITNLS